MSIALISHADCYRHEMGAHHPESPDRLSAISNRLVASGLDYVMMHYDAPLATKEDFCLAHDPDYVEQLLSISPQQGYVQIEADTALNPHTITAAKRAAGAGLLGVDLLLQGKTKQAFCLVRPPGHHAERNKTMGFCLFDNIAIAALHALERCGLERVAIVDFDVHHGNGTEDIVCGDERILFCSSFQHPFYPHSGFGQTASNVINSPLPAGSAGGALLEVIERDWLARLKQHAPQLLLISAGFDGHAADDMAQFNLVNTDYARITSVICQALSDSTQGRVLSILEGGYELHALASSVEAHIQAFLDC